MAKSKASKSTKQKTQVKSRRRRSRGIQSNPERLDAFGLSAARMFEDPCGADLVPTVYPGDRGYINRFVRNDSVAVVAGDTTLIVLVKPGNQAAYFRADATPAISGTIGWDVNLYPGKAFYTSNASKARAAGYCINVRPNSAPNTATGTIYFGNVNAAAFAAGSAITANAIIPMLSESVTCSQALMQPLEIRWSPGGFDDRYNSVGTLTDDDSDRNLLAIVCVGLPAASGIQLRQTALTEWSPLSNLSITNDATSTKPSICDKDCILRHLKRKDPSWWWKLGTKVVGFGKDVAMGYYSGGAIGALGSAVRYM